MRLVHLAKRIAPFWPHGASASGAAELPVATQGQGHEVTVVAAAPVTDVADFRTNVQFARRLDPVVVEGESGFEVPLLEGTLVGSPIRLHLLVMPADHAGVEDFGRAALALMQSWSNPPEVVHLHDVTGVDVDAIREQLDGPAVVQSVYTTQEPETGPSQAAAIHEADEVVTPCTDLTAAPGEDGCPVGEALRVHGRVQAVAHGIDVGRWDPSHDGVLAGSFTPESPEGKTACREALQKEAGFAPRDDVPLLAVWSHAGPESGLGLVAETLDELLALDVQLVVIRPEQAAGDAVPEALLDHEKVWVTPPGEANLRRALAGADGVILPDLTAPLGQRAQISLRYGLVPVARRVNAHRDRLVEFDLLSKTGGAFLFQEPAAEELVAAVGRLRRTFGDRELWLGMLHANGAADFGWGRAAAQLDAVYAKALSR